MHGALTVKPILVHRWAMAADDPYFRLRVPEALKARIMQSAAENNRSMTAEILSRLEWSFEIEPEWKDMAETVNDLLKRFEQTERMVRDHDEHLFPLKYDRD